MKVEAIKVGYKQTKEGDVVQFRIHPEDRVDELAVLPLGEIVTLDVKIADIGA